MDALREALREAMEEEGVDTAGAYAKKMCQSLGSGARGAYSRTARVNTLKMSVEDALEKFRGGGYECAVDGLIDTLLVFPAGTDLHAHALVKRGAVVLQGRASCLPAVALAPERGWACIDACAAPGNKTTQLAAMVGYEGGVFAFDADARRLKRLKENAQKTGSHNIIRAKCQDFLTVDPEDTMYASVRALLLDPSCSGSGTEVNRGDILLRDAFGDDDEEENDVDAEDARINKLAAFQKSVLTHAFTFPEVERISYSTCSVHNKENEEVVRDVLDAAKQHGFRLAHALPKWHRRGVAINGLSEADARCLIRADPIDDDMEGFFVAVFKRDITHTKSKGVGLIPSNPNVAASVALNKARALKRKKTTDDVRPVYKPVTATSKKKKPRGASRTPLFK
jgi:putative methyltransferase